MVTVVSDQLAYPPKPRTQLEAIEDGTALRRKGDAGLWAQGWHAMFVTERFGSAFFQQYADDIGKDRATLTRIRWVASRFTIDHVNRFPGLPFTFFEVVTQLMEDDPETALDLLEKAFDTPGLTCAQFRALVRPDQESSAPAPSPFRAEGQFVLHKLPDGSVIVGVRVQGERKLWESLAARSPLFGQVVRCSLAQIPI
jgi:hypothetical protein